MAETDGRRARGNKARAQILACATRIASTDGLEGLTLGRAAADSGVGKGNIQILFGDKEALQLATLESAVEIYRAAVIEPAFLETTPLERLVALIHGWYRFVEDRILPGGCFINAVSSEYRARPGRIRDRINRYRCATRTRFRDLILAAKESGEIRQDTDVQEIVFKLVAHQAAANVAALMDDQEEFKRAERSSRDSIRSVTSSNRLPRLKLGKAGALKPKRAH